jgi:hypothetical protein
MLFLAPQVTFSGSESRAQVTRVGYPHRDDFGSAGAPAHAKAQDQASPIAVGPSDSPILAWIASCARDSRDQACGLTVHDLGPAVFRSVSRSPVRRGGQLSCMIVTIPDNIFQGDFHHVSVRGRGARAAGGAQGGQARAALLLRGRPGRTPALGGGGMGKDGRGRAAGAPAGGAVRRSRAIQYPCTMSVKVGIDGLISVTDHRHMKIMAFVCTSCTECSSFLCVC